MSHKIWLAAGYIDDIRYLTSTISLGWRWSEKSKQLEYKEEWRAEEEERRYSFDKKTSMEVGKIMNSVNKDLEFTTEIVEDFSNARLPTLDLEIWLERGEKPGLRYSFYEKPMGTKYCVMEGSAMSDNMKRATLSQEVVRRMVNTDEEQPQQQRNEILELFTIKMQRSGYNSKQRKEIIISGLKGYERKLKRAAEGKQKLHRDGKATLGARSRKKLMAKFNWYKKKKDTQEEEKKPRQEKSMFQCRYNNNKERGEKFGKEKPISAVMFVPRTPNGELASLLREEEGRIQRFAKSRIKIVEETGNTAKSLVHESNPWAGEDCLREACLICTSGDQQGDCRRRGVVYQTQCVDCKEKSGRQSVYVGETSRTAFERGTEHARDRKSRREDSHMFLHVEEEHPEEEDGVKFQMKVVRTHQSALSRQIHEAVLIANSWGKNLLNSKNEYNRCIIPRLSVMVGQQEDTAARDKIPEEKSVEWEESTKSRKRDKRDMGENQRKSKRRKRWGEVPPYKGKRPGRFLEREEQHNKKRRLIGPQEYDTNKRDTGARRKTKDQEEKIKKRDVMWRLWSKKENPGTGAEKPIRSEVQLGLRTECDNIQTTKKSDGENFKSIMKMFKEKENENQNQIASTKNVPKSVSVPKKKKNNEEIAKVEAEMPLANRKISKTMNKTPKKIPVGQNLVNPKSIKKKKLIPKTSRVKDIREFFKQIEVGSQNIHEATANISGFQNIHEATANIPEQRLGQSRGEISSNNLSRSTAEIKIQGSKRVQSSTTPKYQLD